MGELQRGGELPYGASSSVKSLCVPAPADGCRPRVGRAATPARAWGLSIHVHVITRLRLVALVRPCPPCTSKRSIMEPVDPRSRGSAWWWRPSPVSPTHAQALNKCEKILICPIVARSRIPAISLVHVERTLLTSIFFRTYRPGPWRAGAITSNRDVCMQSRGALTDGTRRYRAAAIMPSPSQRPWTRIAPNARAHYADGNICKHIACRGPHRCRTAAGRQ